MIEQLKEQIKIVAEARQREGKFKELKSSAYADWENRNRALIQSCAVANQQTIESEARLRELTLQVYAETGNKAPAIGVGIREVTKLEYDAKVAFNWAVEHKMALKLDTSGFEKIVKASPLDFVKITTEPQATISANLEG